MAGAYLVIGWFVMQVVEVMAPALNLPDWVDGFVALLWIAGFPIALVLAWAFDLTPDGIRRTVPGEDDPAPRGFGAVDAALIAGLVVVAGLLSYERVFGDGSAAAPSERDAERPAVIAVLPFANVSADPSQEHISDGLAIDIVGRLEALRVFPVISLNSTFSYKGKAITVTEVSAQLGADYVVEGTVRRAGEALRVTAQLSDGTNGHTLWSETYDRTFADLFELQDEITHSIVASVAPEIQRSEIEKSRTRKTGDLAAYELYLKGLRLGRTESFDDAMRARTALLAATERDPTFAAAWVELAWVEHDQITYYAGDTSLERSTEARDRALEYAQKAVSLDPRLAEARAVLGHMHLHFQRIQDGIREFERAADLNPASASIQSQVAWGRIVAGQYEEGLAAMAAAQRLNPNDPLAWEYATNEAVAHWLNGDPERALERAGASIRMNPRNPYMYMLQVGVHLELGQEAEARAAAQELRRRVPDWTNTTLPLTSLPTGLASRFSAALEAVGWTDPRHGASASPE